MNNQEIRAFIAIELNEQIKSLALKIQNKLKKYHKNIKWVDPKNIHITLQFLGNVDLIQIKTISKIIEKVCQNHRPFCIKTKNIEMFPAQKPQIISLGIIKKETSLKNLAIELGSSLSKIGFSRKNDFAAHITLARIKHLNNINQLKKRY